MTDADELPIAQFGFPGPLREQLVAAIRDGSKTSTTSTVIEYSVEDEPFPEVGQRQAVIDSAGRRVAVIETVSWSITALSDISLEHALAEGEGFRSVAEWRVAHTEYWQSDDMRGYLHDPNFTVSDDTQLVTETFRLVELL
jgi:uncharacterized protein YhfF